MKSITDFHKLFSSAITPQEVAQAKATIQQDLGSKFVESFTREYQSAWELLFNGEGEISLANIAALNRKDYEEVGRDISIPQDCSWEDLILLKVYFSDLLGKLGAYMRLDSNDLPNEATSLPAKVSQAKQLLILDISYTYLNRIPTEIANVSNLRVLDLSSNKLLTQLSEGLTQLNGLEVLELRNNELHELPPWIGQLKHLKKLYINEDKMQMLPPQIGELTQLAELDSSHTTLNSLPRQIGGLKSLKKLSVDLHTNRLPRQIGKLIQLEELLLNMTPKRPKNWWQAQQKKWRKLLNKSILPKQFGHLKKLQSLTIVDDSIYHFPKVLCNCRALEALALQHTRINNLPASIGKLANLEFLNVYELRFENIPPEIKQLKHLKVISFNSGGGWTKENYDTFKSWLPFDCRVNIHVEYEYHRWGVLSFDEQGNRVVKDLTASNKH